MINTKALNQLLTSNADGKLFLRWYVMTSNGSLLAYTTPADIRGLRDQVALISMTWKEQSAIRRAQLNDHLDSPGPDGKSDMLIRNLTMEIDNRNVLVHLLQPGLLLVLEGGVPPRRSKRFHVTVEGPADARYPSEGVESNATNDGAKRTPTSLLKSHEPGSPTGSVVSTTASTTGRRVNLLDIHRRRLDAMADVLARQLQQDRFEMPPDPDDRFF